MYPQLLCTQCTIRKSQIEENLCHRVYNRLLSPSQNMSSRLAAMAAEENFCESFQAFHSSYSDTGLMGIYFVTDMHHIEDMMHWSQNAW